MWVGQTVAVLASGPSMSPQVAEAVGACGVQSIVVNSTFRLMPNASCLYAADEEWWSTNPDSLAFAGLKVSVGRVKGVLQLRNSGTVGFDKDPGALRTGGNSGYQAVHLAAHTGASKILLCGFDMGGQHWHPEHQSPLRTTPQERYPVWIDRFNQLGAALKGLGIEVINCTPGSRITAFPMGNLLEHLEMERAATHGQAAPLGICTRSE